MSQTLHIVRKDVRRLRWVLAMWIAVLGARLTLSIAAATSTDAFGVALMLRELSGTVAMVEILLLALIVARLVHEEPLVGLNAFWLTRPYRANALAGAKLLFAAVVLVALPLIADLVTMRLLHAGPPALLRAGSSAAFGHISWTLSLMVIAVLTPSLGAFVLTIIGLVAALSILVAGMVSLAVFFANEPGAYTPPTTPDATTGVVMLVMYVCAALSVVVYQYRHRRWPIGAAVAMAGLVATIVLPAFWPWPLARAQEIQPGVWANEAVAVLDSTVASEVGESGRFGRRAATRDVNARVTLSNVPPDVASQSIGVRARLLLPDGHTIESSQMGGFSPRVDIRGASDRPSPLRAALGDIALLAPADSFGDLEPWATMIRLTEEEFARYRGQSGRLDATVDFHLVRTREIGNLPLSVGTALDDGVSRMEVVAVQRRTDSLAVAIRRWRARSPLSADYGPQYQYVLRNRSRGEALPGSVDSGSLLGGRGAAVVRLLRLPFALIGSGGAFHVDSDGGGFAAEMQLLRFPGRSPSAESPSIAPTWYDEAEIVVLEVASAGVVTRPLTVEQFVIPVR